MTRPEVVVEQSPQQLASSVAGRLLHRLATIQSGEHRAPSVALTGGRIADAIHAEVARLAPESGVRWQDVDVWWGDERFVPADDPSRNALQARTALLDRVGIDPARVHEIPAAGETTLEEAAAGYADEVRADGGGEFDVVMLGVGPDGHVASLFPGYPQLEVDNAIAVSVPDAPKPPPQRISLTFAALSRAKAVWFLVSGEEKAEAVAQALGGAEVHATPAAGVRGREETVWLLDEAAASRLQP